MYNDILINYLLFLNVEHEKVNEHGTLIMRPTQSEQERMNHIMTITAKYDINTLKIISKELKLSIKNRNGKTIIVIPNSFFALDFYKSNKYKMTVGKLKTSHSISHFLFTFVETTVNFQTATYELTNKEKTRVDKILEKLSNYSYGFLVGYFLKSKGFLSVRDRKLVIPNNITVSFFKDLEEGFTTSSKAANDDKTEIPHKTISKQSESETSRNYIPDIKVKPITHNNLPNSLTTVGNLMPSKVTINRLQTKRIITIVNELKKIYDNTCQICGERIDVGNNNFLSEVHHIQPIGSPHNGPDVIENMIVVCPNHHIMFDRGAITIDVSYKKVIHVTGDHTINDKPLIMKHDINQKYVQYHNEKIFLKRDQLISEPQHYITYGDNVIIIDLSTNEKIKITLEKHYQREFMTLMQQKLLNHKVGDTVLLNGFEYKVLKIGQEN